MPDGSPVPDPFSLAGKVAVVTGGGRGIGQGIALGMARAGADLVLAARTAGQLDATATEVRALGRRAVTVAADLADLTALAGLFDAVDREFGGLDILVNNSGTNRRKPMLEVTPADWAYVNDLNLRSVFFACQHGIRRMLQRGGGRIINIASLTSFLGFKHVSVYGATKGGVAQLTKALAVEFADRHITVNAIAPGYIYTDMTRPRFEDPVTGPWIASRTPMGRHGLPGDLAGTAVYLASPAAAYVTGVVIPVDGGWLAG
ncbi:MAG: glucose 1-dehydrogenase [Actinobacteria bacterium]|nr:glucose 1-dehydrogenase [Actinomycetota bacterium]